MGMGPITVTQYININLYEKLNDMIDYTLKYNKDINNIYYYGYYNRHDIDLYKFLENFDIKNIKLIYKNNIKYLNFI